MAGVITQRKMMQHVNLLLISTNKGDARWNRDPSVYHGLDCMDKFMEVMGPLNTEIREVFHKTMHMKKLTWEQQQEYAHACKCYCCLEKFSMPERKEVRDHCHIIGEYRGAPAILTH